MRTNIRLLIPIYIFPVAGKGSSLWTAIAEQATKVDITVIIDPTIGQPDEDYFNGLDTLNDAGITILGYVPTGYGGCFFTPDNEKCSSFTWGDQVIYALHKHEIKEAIDLYNTNYKKWIQGIFFDEFGLDEDEKYPIYGELYQYVKRLNQDFKVVVNPGSTLPRAYFDWEIQNHQKASDVFVVFEESASAWTNDIQLDCLHSFSVMIHDVAEGSIEAMEGSIDSAAHLGVEYIYMTDAQFEPDQNPWDKLPTFWKQEVDYIAHLNDSVILSGGRWD